jgi:hypothetical protein
LVKRLEASWINKRERLRDEPEHSFLTNEPANGLCKQFAAVIY